MAPVAVGTPTVQGEGVDPRELAHRHLSTGVRALDGFNQRHPWSHNDHFHGWILRRLPRRRDRALDVGCGQGELLARLAAHFDAVDGTDRDPAMRQAARRRVEHLPHVSVSDRALAELEGPYDLITLVAVLHHLDIRPALEDLRRLLAPGGRLLVVGLARPHSRVDWAWDIVCVLSNPVIGLLKHPSPVPIHAQATGLPFPVLPPQDTYDGIRATFRRQLPATRTMRRVGFRYTATWSQTGPRASTDGPAADRSRQ